MPVVLRPSRRLLLPGSVTHPAGSFRTQPLAYFSGFWLLITLLFLSTVPAYAEWVAVERDYFSPGLSTIYIDPDTIRREGNLVMVWQLVDFKTMQSRVIPHLYFAGELLDFDGITGGFNFQAAWTTGWIAGHAMADREPPAPGSSTLS